MFHKTLDEACAGDQASKCQNNIKIMFILLLMIYLKRLITCVECICCIPIMLYGLYLSIHSYKYELELDQPTIKAPNVKESIDHYI